MKERGGEKEHKLARTSLVGVACGKVKDAARRKKGLGGALALESIDLPPRHALRYASANGCGTRGNFFFDGL